MKSILTNIRNSELPNCWANTLSFTVTFSILASEFKTQKRKKSLYKRISGIQKNKTARKTFIWINPKTFFDNFPYVYSPKSSISKLIFFSVEFLHCKYITYYFNIIHYSIIKFFTSLFIYFSIYFFCCMYFKEIFHVSLWPQIIIFEILYYNRFFPY